MSPKKKPKMLTVSRFPPLRTPLSNLRSGVLGSANRFNDRIGSTIDSLKILIVELGLAYAVSRVGAVENSENINVATLTYCLRKKNSRYGKYE